MLRLHQYHLACKEDLLVREQEMDPLALFSLKRRHPFNITYASFPRLPTQPPTLPNRKLLQWLRARPNRNLVHLPARRPQDHRHKKKQLHWSQPPHLLRLKLHTITLHTQLKMPGLKPPTPLPSPPSPTPQRPSSPSWSPRSSCP
jgi:hypothetical protein